MLDAYIHVFIVEITTELQTKTFLERFGFRNKRKEQKIFDIGTDKLLKCRQDLEKIIQESFEHQAVKLEKKEEILECHNLAIDLNAKI